MGAPFDANGHGTLVVALGTEGVLVKTPAGEWSQYAVGPAAPTPMWISSLDQWKVVAPDLEVWLYVGLAMLVVFAVVGWCLVSGADVFNAMNPLLASLILMSVGALLLYASPLRALGWGEIGWWAYPVLIVWLLVVLYVCEHRIVEGWSAPDSLRRVIPLDVLGWLVFSATVWLSMLAWAFGWIQVDSVAIMFCIALAVIEIFFTITLLYFVPRARPIPNP